MNGRITHHLTIIAMSLGLLVSLVSAGSAQTSSAGAQAIPWYKAGGKPDIEVGRSVGFYVWHEGDEVHVATTDESSAGQHFTGNIVVANGAVSDLTGIQLEKNDKIAQVGFNAVQFSFETYKGLDELKFRLHQGTGILLDLYLQGQHTGHLFYGKNAVEAANDPLVFAIGQPAPVLPWSTAVGAPDIDPGNTVGFFTWHVGNQVSVITTSESDLGQIFEGRIVVKGGTITSPTGLHLEKEDWFSQVHPNELLFRFKTHEATDGIRFTVQGGTQISFSMQYEGHPTEHIFYGADAREAEDDPLVFDLTK